MRQWAVADYGSGPSSTGRVMCSVPRKRPTRTTKPGDGMPFGNTAGPRAKRLVDHYEFGSRRSAGSRTRSGPTVIGVVPLGALVPIHAARDTPSPQPLSAFVERRELD